VTAGLHKLRKVSRPAHKLLASQECFLSKVLSYGVPFLEVYLACHVSSNYRHKEQNDVTTYSKKAYVALWTATSGFYKMTLLLTLLKV
jgi:hypothetical protein